MVINCTCKKGPETIRRITITSEKTKSKTVIYKTEDGEEFENLHDALHNKYRREGNLYQRVFGVDEWTAKAMGWDPDLRWFNENSAGWRKFIEDRGQPDTEKTIEDVPVRDLIFENEEEKMWREALDLWKTLSEMEDCEVSVHPTVFKNEILKSLGYGRMENGCPFCEKFSACADGCPIRLCGRTPYAAWVKKVLHGRHDQDAAREFYEFLVELREKEV